MTFPSSVQDAISCALIVPGDQPMDVKPPNTVQHFQETYGDVWKAFSALADKCHEAGPLDERNRRALKLGLAIGAGLEGGVHSAVRHALASGFTPDEVRHAAILAISTIGFPSSMRAFTWIQDCLSQHSSSSHE